MIVSPRRQYQAKWNSKRRSYDVHASYTAAHLPVRSGNTSYRLMVEITLSDLAALVGLRYPLPS
jgi:hypothetical protein